MEMKNSTYDKVIMITGGAGFIGSHVVRHFVKKYPNYYIINFDALTYAGNLENLKDIENESNYKFILGDIKDISKIKSAFDSYGVTDIIHLAAESHVDRSILNPSEFVETNVNGTCNLLNVAKVAWKDNYNNHRFHHVSTDEVYGALDMNPDNKFTETTPYNPHSPYSASKASSDHFVKAYHDTYGMNVTISNCSNNYGPNQFPEKLIPLVINKLKTGEDIPVYGKGENIRDWLYVEDHAKAIDIIFHKGKSGETYNVGGNHEMSNINIIKTLMKVFAHQQQLFNIRHGIKYFTNPEPTWVRGYESQIKYVTDRAGHDLRYAIDASKIQNELGWTPEETFETGIEKTVRWYLDNQDWLDNVTSGEYTKWLNQNYAKR